MAARFWVLGTGTWDAVTTTNWAASSGGAGGQSVPGSADAVTFDGASGGGTVTVNFGGTITVQSITCGAFTGTLDFSANNNSVTLSASAGMNFSGSGARTINLGNGTWSLTSTAAGTPLNFGTTTGLTFNANSSIISLTAASSGSSIKILALGTLSFATITLGVGSGGLFSIAAGTIATLNISGPNAISIATLATVTVTNSLSINGSSGNEIGFFCGTIVGVATISSANNGAFTYCSFRDVAFTGGGTFTATNSIDSGHNSGITITAPSAGGGGLAANPLRGFVG